jgi:hypothetical protein
MAKMTSADKARKANRVEKIWRLGVVSDRALRRPGRDSVERLEWLARYCERNQFPWMGERYAHEARAMRMELRQ